MLYLNDSGLAMRQDWLDKGYSLPAFDRRKMIAYTKKSPVWIHFGAGNIFRALQCAGMQKLLDQGLADAGIIAVEGFDYEIIEKGYRPFDNLSLLVTLKADGQVQKTVLASVAESCILDSRNESEFNHLKEIFASPSLQMASFTITEKGYKLHDAEGELLQAVASDFEAGPQKPQSYLGKVAGLLFARYRAGAFPLAMVSMDNCSHNGEKLFEAVHAFAAAWKDPGFLAYISDPSSVSFPCTMIDKITPRPNPSVEELLKEDGLQNLDPVVTRMNTYIAPFVNAEESEYLVIEDTFPNGRPPLETAGFLFTDRETVNVAERMKVTTCLNPLHTALAVFGCLLGYTRICEEMKDEDLVRLIKIIGYREGLPVVNDPGILSPKDFLDTVVHVRLPNPYMPDSPQRIACDTSQKIPIRFGETIKSYLVDPARDVSSLQAIPLVIAGWFRYLLGVDDQGQPFTVSPDPLLPRIQKHFSKIRFGHPDTVGSILDPLLKDEELFGVSLLNTPLESRIKQAFSEMLTGKGAVRKVLQNLK